MDPAFPRAGIPRSSCSEPSHWTVVLTHAPLVLVSTTRGQPMEKYDFRLSRQYLEASFMCLSEAESTPPSPGNQSPPITQASVPPAYCRLCTHPDPLPCHSALRRSRSLLLQHQDPRGQPSMYSRGGGLGSLIATRRIQQAIPRYGISIERLPGFCCPLLLPHLASPAKKQRSHDVERS